jgi:hypothetical protein
MISIGFNKKRDIHFGASGKDRSRPDPSKNDFHEMILSQFCPEQGSYKSIIDLFYFWDHRCILSMIDKV